MKTKNMRIVYMGTPDFAVAPLKALIDNGYDVVGVVTVPDRPCGRGQQLRTSAVKEYALKVNTGRAEANASTAAGSVGEFDYLRILQPEKLRDQEWLSELASLKADLFIVVAFRMLPKIVWSMPRFGTFNLHASLLPDYRGAAPINWAIINGEKRTGVTTFFIDENIDCGRIIDNAEVEITDTDNAGTLHDKLMNLGSELVIRTVQSISEADVVTKEQPEVAVKKDAPKIFKDDCKLDWAGNCEAIHNKIKGLSPYPAAWAEFTPQLTAKVLESSYEKINGFGVKPGELSTDGANYLKMSAVDGWISIEKIHPAGKKAMKIKDFLRGYKLQ